MGMICDCEPFEVCPSCAPPLRVAAAVPVTETKYSVAQIKELAYDYCGDATSVARLDDRLRLSLFISWLAKREKELRG